MAGKKRPGFPPSEVLTSPRSDKWEIVGEPTPEDLWDQLRELMERQAGPDPDRLPKEIYLRRRRLLEWLITHPTPEQIHWLRWRAVSMALDKGYRREDDGAYEAAARSLERTPAEAGPDAMKKSFDKMQKDLPVEQKRPRTWRKRQ